MGGACSSRSQVHESELKLLLLGGANVGKSTIFKQMRLLYKEGFEEKDRDWARGCIHENIMETLIDLDAATDDFGVEVLEENEELVDEIKPELLSYKVRDMTKPAPRLEIWDSLERLWNDPGIQAAFQEIQHPTHQEAARKDRNIAISTGYFLKQLDRIKREDFVPTDDDILHLRRSTSDSERIDFKMEVMTLVGMPAVLKIDCVDVGGQAHERTEWPRHAEGVSAVLYVLSLSEFCSFGQNGANVLQSQLDLLEMVRETECFGQTTIIVLLNKVDILEAKLKGLNLSDTFPDYTGNNDRDDVVNFFKVKVAGILSRKKEDQNGQPLPDAGSASANGDHQDMEGGSKEVEAQMGNIIATCATDTELMRNIIERIGQSILQKTLAESKFF
ncbi:Guanine nucleotide-binding protein subunit alpha [Hondaea fermentalgiana]|uniref:Guanine nucleotide-binding protein subunit alpha n=1 Tax=Hondaea fermentalgiana TaxID=2315210 RepID=A0A2R5G7J0_9STRA|nr:Guanine nucleotide-binding protein subunit alpha [Hondaea fermentalgiana]|eukprot:GBG26505.1 Guanine nucleotide-binding protein subunit alpha [Hondaea fermentalgiana]